MLVLLVAAFGMLVVLAAILALRLHPLLALLLGSLLVLLLTPESSWLRNQLQDHALRIEALAIDGEIEFSGPLRQEHYQLWRRGAARPDDRRWSPRPSNDPGSAIQRAGSVSDGLQRAGSVSDGPIESAGDGLQRAGSVSDGPIESAGNGLQRAGSVSDGPIESAGNGLQRAGSVSDGPIEWPRLSNEPRGAIGKVVMEPVVPDEPAATLALEARPGDWLVPCGELHAFRQRWPAERWSTIPQRLSAGLAGTFERLGLAIMMACLVGACLLQSGAANSIVHGLHRFFGEQRTAPTLVISGFVLGIPIFFDTVFYLLLPLAKAFARRRKELGLLAVMSVIIGATMAHSLVPPTPGPLLVASQLGVSLGAMMLGGLLVGSAAVAAGYLYSLWCNRTMDFQLDYTTTSIAGPSVDEGQASSEAPTVPLRLAVLPLVVPILCLGGSEIAAALGFSWARTGDRRPAGEIAWWRGLLELWSQPGFVLMVSAAIAYLLLRRGVTARQSLPLLTRALQDAGMILLLTCAGGAFGAALQQLRLDEAIAQGSAGLLSSPTLLPAAFLLTGLIRVAQGSATVAMITAVSVLAPLALAQPLPFHPVYLALAIGCGSKLMPWMNDSGFWQVSTMTGLSAAETLKTFSAALTLMGCTGFAVTMLAAWLFPLR